MSNALNLPEIDQEQALQLVKFFIHSQHNLFLFGQKGVGKTELAIQAIQECGYKIHYINLSVIERSDLAGYPDMLAKGETVQFKAPHFLPKLSINAKPDSVLLFDEADKVSPEVMAPLLEILRFKKINGVPINASSCILTGNLPNERAHSQAISSALLDRGAKYILNFNFEHWVEWAKTHGVHDLILGFLRSNPEFACGKIDDTSYASPSPRGWTLASRALERAKDLKMTDIGSVAHIVSGYVGSRAGRRFRMWYEYYRKFEPMVKVLIERGEMPFGFEELMPTEKVVLVISACYYAKQKVLADKTKGRFAYLERLCEFFQRCQVEPEVRVLGLHGSFDFGMVQTRKLYTCKPFFDHFTRLNEGITLRR